MIALSNNEAQPSPMPAPGSLTSAEARPGPAVAAVQAWLDPAPLRALHPLDPSGAKGLVGRVLAAFVSATARLRTELLVAREAGDRKTIERVAHTLKSSAGIVGAARLAGEAAVVEAAVRSGAAGLDGALDAMTLAIDASLTAVVALQAERG